MISLYPLKFDPIYKDKIWGGDRFKTILKKKPDPPAQCGESWELSGLRDNLSVVKNGFLAENTIEEIIEVYMGDLVGDKNYSRFGIEFPLLIKLIDANDILSIQVHPDDALAYRRHHAYGKTELWYVISAEPGAELIAGFNREVDLETYKAFFNRKTLPEILNVEKVTTGDSFFIPSGTIHAINKGILLAEIQQTSDITYRIYDWDRKTPDGKSRELHTDLATDAIHFGKPIKAKINVTKEFNKRNQIIACNYFTTHLISFDKFLEMDYNSIDSFVVYMCLEGSFGIVYHPDKEAVEVQQGETVLIPAEIKELILEPRSKSKLLEIFIP